MPDLTLATNVVPSVLYRDADRGMAWLQQAFGFLEHAVYRDPKTGTIVHAELLLPAENGSSGMVMLGTSGGNAQTAPWYKQPDEAGAVTGAVYLIVADCDSLYERAIAAGAEVLKELATMDYGGKAFTVRDPEGHIWSVGEYNPWVSSAG